MRPNARRCIVPMVLCAALAALTCHSTAYFDVPLASSAEVAAGATPAAIDLPQLGNIVLAQVPTLESQGLGVDDVHQARLAHAGVAVTRPATGQGLEAVQALDLLLEADGMAAVAIAHGEAFEAGINSVPLTAMDVDLLPYLRAKHPRLSLRASWRAPAPAALQLQAQLALAVRIGEPAGSCND